MDSVIKSYADNHEIKKLKYIFLDALDVDPTFAHYQEGYEYCKKKLPDFLDEYVELTPFKLDPKCWDEEYWISLKVDLNKNFSDRRMMHMREVAKVFLAEKIKRMQEEREREDASDHRVVSNSVSQDQPENTVIEDESGSSLQDQERLRVEEEKRKFQERQRQQERANNRKRQESQHKKLVKENQNVGSATSKKKVSSKKEIGIVVIIVAVLVAIGILVLVLHKIN